MARSRGGVLRLGATVAGDGVPAEGGVVVGCGGDETVAADGPDAEDAMAAPIAILGESTRASAAEPYRAQPPASGGQLYIRMRATWSMPGAGLKVSPPASWSGVPGTREIETTAMPRGFPGSVAGVSLPAA
jgi:hypothetical protein